MTSKETSKEALNNIAVYSAFHHNVLDGSVIVIKQDLERLAKLEKVLEIIKEHFFLENFSDFISINGRLDKADYNINEINLLKEVFENSNERKGNND